MVIRRFFQAAALAGFCVSSMAALASDNAVMHVTVDNRLLRGQAPASALTNVEVLAINRGAAAMHVRSPRDAGSGMAIGRRQHEPILIRKRLDKSSPLLAQLTHQTLPKVEIEFFTTGADKKPRLVRKVTLFGASISAIQTSHVKAAAGIGETETISMTFQRIEVTNADGKSSALDDWEART